MICCAETAHRVDFLISDRLAFAGATVLSNLVFVESALASQTDKNGLPGLGGLRHLEGLHVLQRRGEIQFLEKFREELLTQSLQVVSASHPADVEKRQDLG